jgi:putative hydrolase of HD superfamily
MEPSDLTGILEFLRAAESLKTQTRSAWTSAGRPESVAEHTWRLCLMALVLHSYFPDLLRLTASLPPVQRDEITALWDEYESARSPESRLARALDKLETILQHTQGRNPSDFDYRFNLSYGRQFTSDHPMLVAIRALLDEATEDRARENDSGKSGRP